MSRYIKQVKPKQNKSFKSTPISEGGLGLSPSTANGSIDDDIRKAKENKLAKYWYDKYEDLVKEVSYHRKIDRQNLDELDEKMHDMNKGLLTEIASISDSDPLSPLEKKFVTLDKLAEHYKLFLSRIQGQIATLGGGGAGIVEDLDDVDISSRDHKTILMYNNVTKKYEFTNPDMNAGISNEDHSGDEIILNATDSSGTDEGGSIRQENKTATAVPSPTGDIVHTGNLETTGNTSISGTLDVSGVTTFSNVVISDGGTIGSSSDTDAITISSAGLVTLSAAASLSVTGTTTFNQDVNFPGALYNIHWDQPTSKFKFDDNAQCVFGSASGGDMRLFHAGGNSTIKNETGQFRLAGNDIRLQTQNNSEDYIICTDGAAVQMYHNDVEALSTTTSGIQVGASNTNATITTNGTGDLTISTNNGTDSGTIKIEDGANQNITIEPNGTGDIYLNTSGEVGIGSMSGQTIDSVVHIRDADATLTLQRIGDDTTPGIVFQSNGGNARAKMYMDGTDGTNKEIVFENKVSTNMEEKFRVTLSGAKVTGHFEATGAQIDFGGLPTSDPSVAGRLWNDSGTVKVSAG